MNRIYRSGSIAMNLMRFRPRESFFLMRYFRNYFINESMSGYSSCNINCKYNQPHADLDLVKSFPKYELNKYLEKCIKMKEIERVENILQYRCIDDVNAGVLTFLFNYYIDVGEIEKAFILFQNLKDNGKLKHNRLHSKIIIALSKEGKIHEAFQIFQDYSATEFFTKTARTKIPDQKMLIALLNGIKILLLKEKQDNRQVVNERSIITAEINDRSIITAEINEKPKKFIDEVICYTIEYIEKWNLNFDDNLLSLLHEVLTIKNVDVQKGHVGKQLRCSVCHTHLVIDQNRFRKFAHKYAQVLQNISEKQGMSKDFYLVDKYFRNSKFFNVIIDGANFLFKTTKTNKIFTPWRLKNCLNDLLKEKKFQHIALVLPQTFNQLSKMKELNFLNELALNNVYGMRLDLIICKSIQDDVIFLYCAAKSESKTTGKKVSLISNDQFLNHSHMIDQDLKGDWLNWCRMRRVEADENGHLITKKLFFPVHKSCSKVHLVSISNALCIDSMSLKDKINFS